MKLDDIEGELDFIREINKAIQVFPSLTTRKFKEKAPNLFHMMEDLKQRLILNANSLSKGMYDDPMLTTLVHFNWGQTQDEIQARAKADENFSDSDDEFICKDDPSENNL